VAKTHRITLSWIIATGLVLGLLLSSGCGGAKHRNVDVTKGEYYSEDELSTLPDGRKGRYCRDLERERQATQQKFEATTNELEQTRELITSTRTQKEALERELLSIEAELRTLNDEVEEVKALPTTWKIRPGESLSSISALPVIYNDVDKWWKIYEANKDRVPDPYFCFPDTVIVIPRDWPVN
jgi:hypothetical protein